MRITSKGQITIPLKYREQFGLLPETEVDFVVDRDGLRVVKSKKQGFRGQRLIELMRGRGDGKLSTDEIMRMTRGNDDHSSR